MEQKALRQNILGTESIGKLLRRFAVPGIISMVVNSLYNIVDQIFIGQGVGYLGNGATTVIFPLTTLAMAFAMLVGDGAASYFSLMLGGKKEKEAARGAAVGALGVFTVGVILAILYLIFMEPLCRAFGSSDAILPYAISYGRVIAVGVPFGAFCAGASGLVRADGSPKFTMAGLLVGCVLNIVLDPIFIFVFHTGVAGAGYATIIGQIVNFFMLVWYFTKKFHTVRLDREVVHSCLPTLPKVMRLGVSSFITQMALVVAMAARNNMLHTYGAASIYGDDIPITTLGITMKCFSIMMAIIIGLATGAQPIFGYNYGARQYDRVKKTFFYVVGLSTLVCVLAFLVAQFRPMMVLSIFGEGDALYYEFGIKCMRIYLMLIPLAGIQIMSGIFFQALGYPMQASLLSLSKQVIFQLPPTLILPIYLGVEGVLWAGPVSDIIAFAFTVIMLLVYWKKIFAEPDSASTKMDTPMEDIRVAPRKADSLNRPLIVTIGRSYGAGGRSVGRKVAEYLNVPFYDTELLAKAAEESGIAEEYLSGQDESSISRLMMFNAAESQGFTANEAVSMAVEASRAQQAVIESVAEKGSCVIVGRRADQILLGNHNLLRVFITRPLEERVNSVSRKENLSPDDSRRKIRRVDKERADYYNALSDGKWGYAENYDLCMDLSSIGTDAAVRIILEFARMR